jgi:membrane associated rhomboid family serine protease
MPLPRDMLEELGRKRLGESRLADRDKLRDLALTALRCWFWAVAGLACIAWSMHTTVMWLGRAAFWSGLAIGNSGIVFTLLGAYRRGERRGDW